MKIYKLLNYNYNNYKKVFVFCKMTEFNTQIEELFTSIDKGKTHALEESKIQLFIPKIMRILGSDGFMDIDLSMNLSMQVMKIIENMYNHKFGSAYYVSLYELLKKSVKNKEKVNLNNWDITEEQKFLLF